MTTVPGEDSTTIEEKTELLLAGMDATAIEVHMAEHNLHVDGRLSARVAVLLQDEERGPAF